MSLSVHFYKISFSNLFDEFLSLVEDDVKITFGEEIPVPAAYNILVHPTPTQKWLETSQNLRAIIIPWAGIPEKTRKLLKDYPHISVHNLHHNRFNTAELGFGLLLAAAKRIIPMDQALRQNDWSPRYEKTKAILLRHRTALILGYGEIGQALGAYCHGLGMCVLGIKNHPEQLEDDKLIKIYGPSDLHDLLPKADVLIIALPLTDKTDDLIGKQEIALMPKGSILVNVGRGPIVNQYALYEALKTGHLRAAGSDVWYNYPDSKEARSNTPPADVPFGELDNFVLSPHRGGIVEEVESQRMRALATLLNNASRGEPIPNQVDLDRGY